MQADAARDARDQRQNPDLEGEIVQTFDDIVDSWRCYRRAPSLGPRPWHRAPTDDHRDGVIGPRQGPVCRGGQRLQPGIDPDQGQFDWLGVVAAPAGQAMEQVLPDCIMNALFTGSQRNRADDVTISGCVATRHDSSHPDAVSGEVDMRRRAKEFIEISDHTSLDMLIKTLVAIRDNLDPHAEPELKLRGDDIFGRRLSISYFRELTEEEIALDVRYEHAQFSADAREIERLQKALDQIPSRRDEEAHRRAA